MFTIPCVVKDGPFHKAGLRGGHSIIRVTNRTTGRKWEINSAADLKKFRTKCTPGKTYAVDYVAAGVPCTVNITPKFKNRKKFIGVGFKALAKKAPVMKAVKAVKVAEKPGFSTPMPFSASPVYPIEDKAKQSALSDYNVAKLAKSADDNHFMRRARDEMDAVNALLEDMQGADAYIKARNLKEDLLKENANRLRMANENVQKYLGNSASDEVEEPVVEAAPRRRLSLLGKLAVATIAIASLGSVSYFVGTRPAVAAAIKSTLNR